jgi:hypothetical protein
MPRIWQVVNNNGQSAKLICNGEVKIVKRQEAVTVDDFVQGLRAGYKIQDTTFRSLFIG